MDEITLKFGKGCVGEAFDGKDGNSYKQILIPNKDSDDHSPWATFVVRANAVHEDKFGKGMWIKLPAEGSTTVRKSKEIGQDENGKRLFETDKFKVTNAELKGMVEFYKANDKSDRLEDKPKTSLKNKVEKNKEAVAAKNNKNKSKEIAPKAKNKGAEL